MSAPKKDLFGIIVAFIMIVIGLHVMFSYQKVISIIGLPFVIFGTVLQAYLMGKKMG